SSLKLARLPACSLLPSSVYPLCRASRALRSYLLLQSVFFVADLFHPVHDFAVQRFLNGDVRHRGRRCRAVPMLLVRRKPDDIAGPDFFDRSALALRPAKAGSNDQCLTELMRMPRGAGTRLEGDACTGYACVIRCLEQRVNSDVTRKPISWTFIRWL